MGAFRAISMISLTYCMNSGQIKDRRAAPVKYLLW